MAEYTRSEVSAASEAVEITAADSNLSRNIRALWVGTAGDVNVRFINGGTTDITIPDVPAGTLLPIMVSRVNTTLTTASGFVGFYE